MIAQTMSGATLDNYAGVNSAQLNPSALHNSRTWLDVQLLGADLFLENNYLYISKSDYKFSNFFKAGYELPMHPEDYGTEERAFYHYTGKNPKDFNIDLRINGPGAMLIWGYHAFGITTAVRSMMSVRNLPYDLANFAYLGLNYRPQHNINYIDNRPFRITGMAWGELGLSYAYTFYARGFDQFSAGLTVKRLFGLGGMYLHANSIDYVVIDDSTINVKNLDATMGMALPVDYETNSVSMNPLIRGGGFSFDLGVTYKRLARYHQKPYFTKLCSQPYEDYLYRIGVALIDIGGVKYKTNARNYQIDNRSSYWQNVTSIDFRSIDQILDTISYKFYGDTASALTADHFTLWLPSALSIQADYHIRDHWYVNASLIYGFPLSKNAIVRPAELSITPRYETSWFGVSMPVSLYDWYLPRVGLALRIYNLTVGTDKLGGFFSFNNFTGLDFYFTLKLYFNKGSCREKGPKGCGNGEFDNKKLKF
jgi:hypothetical protein